MPKFNMAGFGADAAEAEGGFAPYEGEIPPKNTILKGKVKRVQLKLNRNEDPMINGVFETGDDHPAKKEYNGCPAWFNINVTDQGKGYVNEFFRALGMSKEDIVSFWVEGPNLEDKKLPSSFVGVGDFEFKDGMPVRIMSGRGRHKGVERMEVASFLAPINKPEHEETAEVVEVVEDDEDSPFADDVQEEDGVEVEQEEDGDLPSDEEEDADPRDSEFPEPMVAGEDEEPWAPEPKDEDPVDDEPPF